MFLGKVLRRGEVGYKETEVVCQNVDSILNQVEAGLKFRIEEIAYPEYISIPGNEIFKISPDNSEVTNKEIDFFKWCYQKGYMRKDEFESLGIKTIDLGDNSKIMEEVSANIFGIDLNNNSDLIKNLERFNIWRREVGFLKNDNEIDNTIIANNIDYSKSEKIA